MQNKRPFIGILIIILAAVGSYFIAQPKSVTPPDGTEIPTTGPEAGVRQVVTEFGNQIKNVNLAGSNQEILEDIREHYGPFIAPILLEGWEMAPERAPGKMDPNGITPSHIEILAVDPTDDGAYDVQGLVIEVTNDDEPAGSYQVALKLRNLDGEWVITGATKAIQIQQI